MAGKSKKTISALRVGLVGAGWAAWVFLVLAMVSFHVTDRTNLASAAAYYGVPVQVRNWCGPVGAKLAFLIFNNLGPGAVVLPVALGAVLLVWTLGRGVTQMTFRLIGAAVLLVAISALAHLTNLGASLPAGPGGLLGVVTGHLLRGWFHLIGSMIVLILAVLVGALLAADEIVLAIPGAFRRGWKKVPAEQVVSVTGNAAVAMGGGILGIFRGVTARWHKRDSITRWPKRNVVNSRAGAATEVSPPAVPNEIAGRAEVVAPAAVTPPPDTQPILIRKPKPKLVEPTLPFKPAPPQKQDLGNYRLPGLDLLEEAEPSKTDGQEQMVRQKAEVLRGCLESFGIDGRVVAIDTGPVVTLYELELAPGIKSSQVGALAKDLARALMSPPVRVIDNIPGKNTMGIEVPNLDKERVRLKELMQLGSQTIERMALPMCLGKDASGNPLIEDLTTMPHILIAGTTGSGKSVCINSIIMTFLLTQRPDHVKMIMVDPKMVEMQDYRQIPHLMSPIIDDMSKAESVLEWATQKMDERYETLSEAGVRHIRQFNRLTREQILERFKPSTPEEEARIPFHMPYIVIIIDELADLMMTSKEVEGHIVRIAQKARAVGIHLILATQRPEAQVVTGLIKSNMPGRICFQVRSRLDSRIMLDQSGGELLLGQGDLLMLRPTGGGLMRGQGTFVDDAETKRVCSFITEIAQPEFHPELMQLGAPSSLTDEEKDPMFDEAVRVVLETRRGSVSLLQRRLTIGYSRASRLIDQMRAMGIVGAYKGSQASDVTMTVEEWDSFKATQDQEKSPADDEESPAAPHDES